MPTVINSYLQDAAKSRADSRGGIQNEGKLPRCPERNALPFQENRWESTKCFFKPLSSWTLPFVAREHQSCCPSARPSWAPLRSTAGPKPSTQELGTAARTSGCQISETMMPTACLGFRLQGLLTLTRTPRGLHTRAPVSDKPALPRWHCPPAVSATSLNVGLPYVGSVLLHSKLLPQFLGHEGHGLKSPPVCCPRQSDGNRGP